MSYSEIPRKRENVKLCSATKQTHNNYSGISGVESKRSTVDNITYELSKLHTVVKPTKSYGYCNKTLKYSTISSPDQVSGSGSPFQKSLSLPRNSSLNLNLDRHETSSGNFLRLSVEELASQITLLDYEVFCRIESDELSSCSWTKKDKATTCPNICAFTKRFNNITVTTPQDTAH